MFHTKFCFFLVIIFLLSFSSNLFSQNLYDREHTKRFAGYLFSNQEYCFAASEYERLLFFDTSSDFARLRLLQSNRLCGNYDLAFNHFKSFFGESIYNAQTSYILEYFKLNVTTNNIDEANNLLNQTDVFEDKTKLNFQASLVLIGDDWSKLSYYISGDTKISGEVLNLANSAISEKYKKPFVAAGLSTILPFAGRFYTKDYYDGLISFLLVAGNAWQSYRGFKKKGTESVYGWIMGGLSASFYLGNIFGSHKSALRYNTNIRKKYQKNAKEYLLDFI